MRTTRNFARAMMGAGMVAGVVACAALGGCKAKISPDAAAPEPLPVEQYPNITVEPALAGAIVSDYGRIVFKPGTGTETAFLAAPVRSIANNAMWIQYQINWYDAQGVQIGETAWQRVRLSPQAEEQLQGRSTSGQAVKWRMEIRLAR